MSDQGQGGGGFGAPPGGGFGAPPGGGGFGAPPGGQPPGGGGFGAPPGGSGGAPPGGSGGGRGEAPLAHIPFTPEDEKNLTGMARFAMFAAIAAIVAAFLNAIVSIIQGLVIELPIANPAGGVAGQVCIAVVTVGVAGLLAAFLFKASAAVKKVVETDDADQQNLVAALSALKAYFMVKGIIAIVLTFLFCCLVTVGVFMGAAFASALGNM